MVILFNYKIYIYELNKIIIIIVSIIIQKEKKV